MKGIAAYSKPSPSGGVTVDVDSMLVDLITVYKAGGLTVDTLKAEVEAKWPKVEVSVSIPNNSKN